MQPDLVSSASFPVPPATLYRAWIDGPGHAAMTGAPATSTPTLGGAFTAWEGYITGTWTELVPDCRLTMAWRTSQFPRAAPPARIQVEFAPEGTGTRITLTQWNTPPDQVASYLQGWTDHYWNPMHAHFGGA